APGSDGKRCKDYQDGGTCARADTFVCLEWAKVNGHRLPIVPPPPPSGGAAPRDPSGTAGPVPPAPEPPASSRVHITATGLTEADVARFRALGTEVCLFSPEVGEVWIVPAPTGEERTEITVDQLAVIANAVAAFPGSCVVALRTPAAMKAPVSA